MAVVRGGRPARLPRRQKAPEAQGERGRADRRRGGPRGRKLRPRRRQALSRDGQSRRLIAAPAAAKSDLMGVDRLTTWVEANRDGLMIGIGVGVALVALMLV